VGNGISNNFSGKKMSKDPAVTQSPNLEQNNASLNVDEVRPVLPDENGKFSPQMVSALACVMEGVFRQTTTIAKMTHEAGGSVHGKLRENPGYFFGNSTYRIAGGIAGIYPALLVRSYLDKDSSHTKINLCTTLAETVGSVSLEAYAAKHHLAEIGNPISSNKHLLLASRNMFLPCFFRNYIGWTAVNSDTDNLATKSLLGGLFGLVSSPFDSLANKALEVSAEGKSLTQTYLDAWKTIKLDRSLLQGAGFRSLGAAGSAVFLSQEFANMVRENTTNPFSSKSPSAQPDISALDRKNMEKLQKPKEESREADR